MARLGTGTTTDTTSTSNELYYAGEAFRLAYDVGAGTGSRRVPTNFNGFKITAKAVAVSVTDGDTSTAVPYGLCQVDSDVVNDQLTTKSGCDALSGTFTVGKKPARANQASLVGGYDAAEDLIDNPLTDPSTRDGTCVVSSLLTQVLCEDQGACSVGTTPENTVTTQDVTKSVCDGQENSTFTPNLWTPNEEKGKGKFDIYIPSDILRLVGFLPKDAPQPGSPLYIAYSVDYTEATGTNSAETRVIETDIIGFRWTPMFNITD